MIAGTRGAADASIALLRGINLGPKRKLPMDELGEIFAEAGCRDVRTWLQTGNVIYRAERAMAEAVPGRVEAAIADRFGFEVPVLVRTLDELDGAAAGNPFLEAGADPRSLHVAFLAEAPTPRRVDALDPDRSPPDRFVVRGREIYLHCPNGLGRSKLTNAYFDATLETTSTIRTWRTTLKLLELAEAL